MMTVFKRWTSGLVSRVDSLVVEIENQEALVASAVRDMGQRVARARVQLGRVRRDGEALTRRVAELSRETSLWRDRARTEPDQARAVECLRRAKRAAARHEELGQRLAAHRETEQRLTRDIKGIEQKLERLREQQNTMRTRQTRAEALAMLGSADASDGFELEQVLERWDARITETEILAGCIAEDQDPFAEEFAKEEETAELVAELEALRKEGEQ